MHRIVISIFSFLVPFYSLSQKTIEGLIQAEKNFAAYSVANSTKEAFLAFLDSNGIVFNQRKPVNGMQLWNNQEKRPGVLNWHPQYAEISSSGDFGYTTGPWTFQRSADDTVIARGRYTTVWHINKKGQWKFLIDLGNDNTPPDPSTKVRRIPAEKKSIALKDTLSVIETEKAFIGLLNNNKAAAYKKYLSKKSILNRNGVGPALTESEQKAVIDFLPSIQYTIDGWYIAPGLDIAFVYGTTVSNGKTENYQRIWRHEAKEWKIALEVLRY